jgi:hypothetical protein
MDEFTIFEIKKIEQFGSRHPAILRGADIRRHTVTGKCRNTEPEHYTVVRGTGYIRKESKKGFCSCASREGI